MAVFWHDFYLSFIPLFVVIDAFGNLPFLVTASEGMVRPKQLQIVHIAIITATVVGLVFLFFGKFILDAMNIQVPEFAIAGGIVLLVLSIMYMITGHMVHVVKEEMVAVVPIGTPLTVGPATITTLLLLSGRYHIWVVLLAFVLNMLVTWIIFALAQRIAKFLGQGGLIAISRVFALILAAFGVRMIFVGLSSLGIVNIVP
ncbi:MAG TPA: MarC family protein [Dehalococcoidales bacterium]|nr:MarC family protein [Dehalococcoidales bacterium]